jgi:hypothetical protein
MRKKSIKRWKRTHSFSASVGALMAALAVLTAVICYQMGGIALAAISAGVMAVLTAMAVRQFRRYERWRVIYYRYRPNADGEDLLVDARKEAKYERNKKLL